MKNIFALIAVAGALLLGSGCTTNQAVPKSTFSWNPKTGEVHISSPKDAVLENVQIVRGSTNGVEFAVVSIGKYHANTNPDVVEKSAIGTAQMINAGADAGAKYFALGLQTAAQAMGVPRIPQLQPATPVPQTTNAPNAAVP